MRIEFRGVSTASLGAMLGGYGVMAGVGAAWPDARFWWTPAGAIATDIPGIPGLGDATATADDVVCERIFALAEWARVVGAAFEKQRRKTKKERGEDGKEQLIVLQEAGDPPLENALTWDSLEATLAADAEGVGVFADRTHRSNPCLARWGQDGSGNLFMALREAGEQAKEADIAETLFEVSAAPGRRLAKGGGVFFPDGIKRYATGTGPAWIHEGKKPVGLWDFILAIRGLLLLRGAVRSPRGARHAYPAFPFILPGSVVRAQGSTIATDEVFLPTWSGNRPRTLAEFLAQVRGFQARVGRRDFAARAAEFRRAVAGRAVTGAFDAFHRYALEPRKPGRSSPQKQGVARGITRVGPASAVRASLRFLLARLDDSDWLRPFRLRRTGGKVDASSEKLALAKTCFDEAVHAAIDLRGALVEDGYVRVLNALWDCQLALQRVSEWPGSEVTFRPAPLLEGGAWGAALSELLHRSTGARLGWALASLGWAAVEGDDGQWIRRPVIEQVLPVSTDGHSRLADSESSHGQRVPLRGLKPAREFAALSWRRWLDLVDLPVLPATGTRAADAADVAALLCGEVDMRDLQRHFLAFLLLDGSGDAPPASAPRPIPPAYAALRLWFELSARTTPSERRPLDGSVPRGVATGTVSSVQNACRTALHRLRVSGLPGDWPRRPREKSVARPELVVPASQARLMAAAILIPVSDHSVARLSDSLLLPSGPQEPDFHQRTENTYA